MSPLLSLSLLLTVGPAQAATEVVDWDLGASDCGFVPIDDAYQWEWGEVGSGPMSGWSSTLAWATELDGSYRQSGLDYLVLPSTDLSGVSRGVLTLTHWYDIDPGGDAGWIEVWDGATWSTREPVYGYPEPTGFSSTSQGWTTDWFDISDVSDAEQVRLAFQADDSISRAGWYIGSVSVWDGDNIPPKIEPILSPADTQLLTTPARVQARVTDDLGVSTVLLDWSTDTDSGELQMDLLSDSVYQAEIPATHALGPVCWQVQASDGTNTMFTDPACYRVYLAAPTALSAVDDRVVGFDVGLEWSPPDSPHPVSGYRVYRDDQLVAEAHTASTSAPLQGPEDSFTVSALFATPETTLEGDPSDPVQVNAAVPELLDLDPSEAWQADHVRVLVAGRNLFLEQDQASLDLGAGVHVDEVDVRDVNQATFTLTLDDDAAIGARDAVLTSGDLQIPAEGVFTVLDGADRPRLLSVDPDEATQGQATTLIIDASTPLQPDPIVALGEGLIVEQTQVRGSQLQVDIVVANDAAVGDHAVTVDDGVRVLSGVDLRVRDRTVATDRTCGVTGAPTRRLLWWGLLGAAMVASRRRQHRQT